MVVPRLLVASMTLVGHSVWCHENDGRQLLWQATLKDNVMAKIMLDVYWSPSPSLRSMTWVVSSLMLRKRYTNFYFMLCEQMPDPVQNSQQFGSIPQLLAAAEWAAIATHVKWGFAQMPSAICHHTHKGVLLFPIHPLSPDALQSAVHHSTALGWFFGYVPKSWASSPVHFQISMVANWTIGAMAMDAAGLVHLPSITLL